MALARGNSQGVSQLRRLCQGSTRVLSGYFNSGLDGARAAPEDGGGQFRELGRAQTHHVCSPFLRFEWVGVDERRAGDGFVGTSGGFRDKKDMISFRADFFPSETDIYLVEKTSQSFTHKFWPSSFESALIRVCEEESIPQARSSSPTSGFPSATQVGSYLSHLWSSSDLHREFKQEQFLRSRTPQAILLDPFSRGRHEWASFSTASNAGVSADSEEEVERTKKPNTTASVGVSWVEKNLPKQLRPYAYLARLDKPIGTWLLAWPCFW